jgi:hypothetical protein
MNARLGRGRALRRIERDLANSDPRLDAIFLSFTVQTRGEKMPEAEKIRTGLRRWLIRLGRRADCYRADEDGGARPHCRLVWPGCWWSYPMLYIREPGKTPPGNWY